MGKAAAVLYIDNILLVKLQTIIPTLFKKYFLSQDYC